MKLKENKYAIKVNLLQELFNNSDSESKLILLDEIVAVGEKKELKILNKLLQDSDEAVRQKAVICIAQLQQLINLKEEKMQDLVVMEIEEETGESEPIPLEYAFLSDYESELSKNNIKSFISDKDAITLTYKEIEKVKATFLEQFYSFSSKIFDKLNI